MLWKAVEARSGQRVLYLTWSRELTAAAEEHFRAFAPADVRVEARDFATFLGEVCGADVERLPLSDSRALFAAATARLGRRQAGPWSDRDAALHAEVRAMLVGHAVPGDADTIATGELVRLSDAAYRDRRADDRGVGRAAASALLKVAGHLEPDAFARIFPELAAAAAAVARLRDDELPAGFADFDRVVVDEAQDLTLLETAVVVELCLAVARRRGHAPWLLAAGDDGQTVRPSGFEWGALNDLLAARLDAPRRFHLEDNLRCPTRIAGVIERASEWYVHLDKARRPTKQRQQRGGQHVDAHLLHVVADVPTAVGLLERLDEVEGLVVITVGDERPVWLPERLRDMVLTPADAKGLEYQSVCVLDPGRVLARLEAATGAMASPTSQALREHEHRTAIDQLRVALSRATETLAFVDVAGDDDAHALSAELLEDAAPYDADDLVEHFADDAPPDERVQARTHDARALIDTAPGRAWQRACQAMRLLGDPQLPNGVSDERVRIEAHTTLLATAARLLVDGVPAAVRRDEVVNMAAEAIVLLGRTDHYGRAFEALDAWTQAPQTPPFALLDATLGLDSDGSWVRQALPPVAQRLRDAVETFADEPAAAGAYAGDVEGWLQLTGYAGDAAAKARALRCRAVDTLTEAGETLGAAQVLVAVKPPDLARLGAAARSARPPGGCRRNLRGGRDGGRRVAQLARRRQVGAGRAVGRGPGAQRPGMARGTGGRDPAAGPAGQRKRLTAGERERLVQLLDSVERLPRSGRTAAAATALPLVILPTLGPGLPPGFIEADGMPPVPDKARTGRFFGRRVMEFQNWTLASNPRWR